MIQTASHPNLDVIARASHLSTGVLFLLSSNGYVHSLNGAEGRSNCRLDSSPNPGSSPGKYCFVMLCFPKPVLHAGQGLDDIAVAWYVNVFKSHCRDHILTASAHCTVYATCCFIVSLGICLGTSHTRMGLESSLPVTWQWVSPLGDIIHQPTPSLAKPSCKNHRASLLYQVAMLF